MIRITTLIENAQGEHKSLKSEHGLSFCIETERNKVLFDSGQSGTFINNADQLRIDLSTIDHVVLSHGHYDHSGGVRFLIKQNRQFSLLVGKGFFVDKYAEIPGGGYEFLGNNFSFSDVSEWGINFDELTLDVKEVVSGVFAVTNFERTHTQEKINPRFKLLTSDGFVSDPFNDEVMMVVDSTKGLICLLGCSHPGMQNMLTTVKKRFNKPIYAVLGGTHLVEANDETRAGSLAFLRQETQGIIGISHCSGPLAMAELAGSEKRYFHNKTGTAVIVL